MGLIRLILLLAALWLAWRLLRNLLGQNAMPPGDTTTPPPRDGKMIKCERCGVHVPESEAFSARGHTFCSLEHQTAWLDDHHA